MIGIDSSFLISLEIVEHPRHAGALGLLRHHADAGETFGVTPSVLAEFIHVVTDARRFERPLSMVDAVERARFWLTAQEVRPVYCTVASEILFLDWMLEHHLGRKRILDTQMAAAYWIAGVRQIATANPGDFRTLGFDALEF